MDLATTTKGVAPICSIQLTTEKPCYIPYPDPKNASFAAVLKRRRLDLGLTQETAANILEIRLHAYQCLEWGIHKANIRIRKKVNEFLGYNFWDDGSGSLSNRLLLYRIENRLTVKELADKLSISKNTVYRLEKNNNEVSQETLKKINNNLKCLFGI